jgi:hypothetical protein
MRFLSDTLHRHSYAASEIISYGPPQKYSNSNSHYVEAKLRDGRAARFDVAEIERAEEAYVGFIPAAPGTWIIHDGAWQGETWISRSPVIGWALKQDGSPVPVTPEGPEDQMYREMPVEMPGGHVFPRGNADGRRYDNAEEFVTDRLQERAKAEADRLSKAEVQA